MNPLAAILARFPRAARFGLVLAVLLLGAAGHWWHHVTDPGCADGASVSGHACALCASLHGSTLAAARTTAPAPVAAEWRPAPRARALAPRVRARIAASPRAPPANG